MLKSFLFALFLLLPSFAFAVEETKILDIPASESSEDENVAIETSDTMKAPANSDQADKDSGKKAAQEVNSPSENNMVILRGLNKVIGRISTLEVPLGTVSNFENLEIIARKCWKSLPEEKPENAALLEVREIKIGEAPRQIFLGWMFSSSPSISGLEHPVYDITVLSCEFRKDIE